MNSKPLKNINTINLDFYLEESRRIIDSIETTWTKNKAYKYKLNKQGGLKISVQTYHKNNLNNDYWCARSCDLHELSDSLKESYYEQLMKYLVGNVEGFEGTHSNYEENYIEELEASHIHPIEKKSNGNCKYITYLTRGIYKFHFPLRRRVFHELVHIVKANDESEAYIISLATDPSEFEYPEHATEGDLSHHVDGRYTSIEKISFDRELKQLKWIMCTCSDPDGWVPKWLAKLSMNSAISKDVPRLLNWVDSSRDHR